MHSPIERNVLQHYKLKPGSVPFMTSDRKTERVYSEEERISGEAYDINNQTIYIVPKSTIESRMHYAPEPTQAHSNSSKSVPKTFVIKRVSNVSYPQHDI